MENLILNGRKYEAKFQNIKREGDKLPSGTDGDEGDITPWADYKMWWAGDLIIIDKETQRNTRCHFRTLARRNVPGGIRDESFEDSFLLVRGKDSKGKFVSYKGGRDVITNREGVIDYLLGRVYNESSEKGKDEFLPKINIPLLEQHDLAQRGYAKAEVSNVKT